jgi:thiol-disulfide isomerase/thioredoxin
MALIHTPPAKIGTLCPEFSLTSVDGKNINLKYFDGAKAFVVMFICNHCPYVQAIEDRILDLAQEMIPQGVQFLGISSNDFHRYPDDSPENILKRTREKKYPFLYAVDENQEVAHKFGAVCTPDFFIYDAKKKLAYRGRLDDSWKDASKVTRQELKLALFGILNNQSPPTEQIPSMGCSIKWRNLE